MYELANNPTDIDDNWPLHNKINSVSVIVIPDTPTPIGNLCLLTEETQRMHNERADRGWRCSLRITGSRLSLPEPKTTRTLVFRPKSHS